MIKLITLSSMLLISLFSSVVKAKVCDISGIWQHSAKAAKLFLDLNKGEISVHSHEITPDSIGLVVLKNVKLDSRSTFWNASMYSAAQDVFVDVKITAKTCEQLSVSYQNEEVLGLEK